MTRRMSMNDSAPPTNEVPATVALDAELLSTDSHALFCSSLQVYSNGFHLRLELRARERTPGRSGLFELLDGGGPEAILIGLEYGDGRRGQMSGWRPTTATHGGGVSIMPRGGGGGDLAVDADFFVSPLPPPGAARLVCAWPAQGPGDVIVELPVDELLEAAARVRQLWPLQPEVEEAPPEPERPPVPDSSWFAH